ncbi:MAG TPA: hypothetical protein VLL52_23410 [Anaerolineae bacterium]|nr:hypothetical protein [Anaerolineae bacterium]
MNAKKYFIVLLGVIVLCVLIWVIIKSGEPYPGEKRLFLLPDGNYVTRVWVPSGVFIFGDDEPQETYVDGFLDGSNRSYQ